MKLIIAHIYMRFNFFTQMWVKNPNSVPNLEDWLVGF